MKRFSVPIRAGVLGAFLLTLAACGGPTRVATLNETTQISGASVATTLRQQLANHGFSNATVSCAKMIIVNVGPATSCRLTGAGMNGTVMFTFRTLDGRIDTSSVKVS